MVLAPRFFSPLSGRVKITEKYEFGELGVGFRRNGYSRDLDRRFFFPAYSVLSPNDGFSLRYFDNVNPPAIRKALCRSTSD